jgi:hypothetical protein
MSSPISSTFSVILLVLGLQLTLNQSSNVNVIQNALSGLENVLQKHHEAFQSFGSGFTKLHAKLDADMLLNFAIHQR